MLVQPHDGSMFDVFIAGEMVAWPVLHQGREKVKILWCQIRTVRETVQRLPTEILQQVPSLLGRVRPGIVTEENHTTLRKVFSVAQQTLSISLHHVRTRRVPEDADQHLASKWCHCKLLRRG
jgi:hypothetical protein